MLELVALPNVGLLLQDIHSPLSRHEPDETHFANGDGQWLASDLEISWERTEPLAAAILRADCAVAVRMDVLFIDTPP